MIVVKSRISKKKCRKMLNLCTSFVHIFQTAFHLALKFSENGDNSILYKHILYFLIKLDFWKKVSSPKYVYKIYL